MPNATCEVLQGVVHEAVGCSESLKCLKQMEVAGSFVRSEILLELDVFSDFFDAAT